MDRWARQPGAAPAGAGLPPANFLRSPSGTFNGPVVNPCEKSLPLVETTSVAEVAVVAEPCDLAMTMLVKLSEKLLACEFEDFPRLQLPETHPGLAAQPIRVRLVFGGHFFSNHPIQLGGEGDLHGFKVLASSAVSQGFAHPLPASPATLVLRLSYTKLALGT
ncbi:hypothetical protein LBMAG56_35560 [Verrucomicrobiota bacterium]|nr:hypothetical protein LBMAG56_35560 [Verrucomicrobiota bacterium]